MRPAENYCENHLPGAVHLDLFGISSVDTDPAPLKAFFWIIEHLLASRGVSNDVPVVVYDDTSGIRAARAFWFLEFFGHPDTRVLDGGYHAWVRNGAAGHAASGEAEADGLDRHARRGDSCRLARRAAIASAHPDAVILDTRSDGEYCGTNVRAARGGAIPGAVHLEWTNNLAPDGAFKSRRRAESRCTSAQASTPDREVVTYCQGGYRAAHSYLALRLIGYPRVRNYVGSWKEWGDRVDLPIEHPKEP